MLLFLSQIMVANYLDNQHSWVMNNDGSYAKISCNKKSRVFSAHDYFMMNPSLSGRGKIKGAKNYKIENSVLFRENNEK